MNYQNLVNVLFDHNLIVLIHAHNKKLQSIKNSDNDKIKKIIMETIKMMKKNLY